MKTCTIFNAASGSADRNRREVQDLAEQDGSQVYTLGKNHATGDLLEDARRHGCQRIVVVGGDGTLSTILRDAGPMRSEFEWAIVPAGTGNDLARSLAIPLDDPERAWDIAMQATAVTIDLVRVDEPEREVFVNAANGGFGGKVANDVQPEDKERWGALAYWMTALSEFADIDQYQVTLELDDRTLQRPITGLAVANGRYVGGGFPIAPQAMLNDGFLDVSLAPVLPATELFTAGLNFTLGRHDVETRIMTFRSKRVQVRSVPDLPFSIDGEPIRAMDATFEVVPAALRVAAAEDAPAIEHQPATTTL